MFIAGNWKMNLDRAKSLDLVKTVKGRIGDGSQREVAFFVPAIYLADVSAVAQGSPLGVGGQNVWSEDGGAFTGEIAPRMLREVGADRVLIGHSERRHIFREVEEWMGRKLRAALDADLQPIFCIGETLDERNANRTDRVLKKQLESGFERVTAEDAHHITIAYEPVWAIGTGLSATPNQAQEMHKFIREKFKNKFSESISEKLSIIYGGSVKPSSAKEIFAQNDVDGGLIGGASLKSNDFADIVNSI